jgi:hypothetical protein
LATILQALEIGLVQACLWWRQRFSMPPHFSGLPVHKFQKMARAKGANSLMLFNVFERQRSSVGRE